MNYNEFMKSHIATPLNKRLRGETFRPESRLEEISD